MKVSWQAWRRFRLAGLVSALLAVGAQVAAAMPLACPATTIGGVIVPICGAAADQQAGAADTAGGGADHRAHCLLDCARCLCCHAPAMLPASVPVAPLPTRLVYPAAIRLPPPTAPPAPVANRPPTRAPPHLA